MPKLLLRPSYSLIKTGNKPSLFSFSCFTIKPKSKIAYESIVASLTGYSLTRAG